MGKTLIKQARGRGGPAYRVRKKAYIYKITYPRLDAIGKAKIVKLINSVVHSTPLMQVSIGNELFYSPAFDGAYESQEISIVDGKAENGNILMLKDVPPGTKVFNLELAPGKGGKVARSSGCYGLVMNKDKDGVEVIVKRRKLRLNENCRATIGIAAGDGRTLKPLVKAGKKFHMMIAKGRKWHYTSAIKTNALDHPFGSGRGKRIKSKIAKRNAPPGKKVGHIRPKRTGYVK